MLGARQEVLPIDLRVLLDRTAEDDFRDVLDERPREGHDPVDHRTLAAVEAIVVKDTVFRVRIEVPTIV